MGMLPVPEIQYLAYLHNAIDQLEGSLFLQFSSRTVQKSAVESHHAYQKGFGGHFTMQPIAVTETSWNTHPPLMDTMRH